MTEETQHNNEAPPPILKKWSRLYWAVMINLAAWLLMFFIFRRIFE
jgi:hypothetical protein